MAVPRFGVLTGDHRSIMGGHEAAGRTLGCQL